MKKTFKIIFDVEGDTCAEYKDLVDKFMSKQMDLAEQFIKTVDQDETLKQSRVTVSINNDFYTLGDYERCSMYYNEKGKEYYDEFWSNSRFDNAFTIEYQGSSGITKEEWEEFQKQSRERWEENKRRCRQDIKEK